MKKHVFKIIGLSLATVLILSCLISCGTAGKEGDGSGSASDTSESAINMHDRVPSEDEKDEPIITEDEKNGIIAEGLLGVSGSKVLTYEGFLGYGYNLLEAAYYNQGDIKASYPVIDMDALAAAGYVYLNVNTANAINSCTFISDTTKEYSRDISASANLDAKVGLTGSFKASFSMDYTSEIKSEAYNHAEQALYTQRFFIRRL